MSSSNRPDDYYQGWIDCYACISSGRDLPQDVLEYLSSK